ncbi:MAG: methyl-coenzyme M reductase subunit beta, partial [Candidatus Methanomethylophilaceae archaeon]|nr:methyl-coenzyme M reductase subunit beta [Candidatus Methanomethylophilaceae archaeon]
MPKYEDVIDLYDDNGKRIAKDVPLESISPLRNNAIKEIVSLTKRTVAVSLGGIEKALKTGSMTGGGVIIQGKELDLPIVKSADKIAAAIKEKVQVYDGDGTIVKVKGSNIIVVVPEERMNAGVEYTTGFTATAAATTEAIID